MMAGPSPGTPDPGEGQRQSGEGSRGKVQISPRTALGRLFRTGAGDFRKAIREERCQARARSMAAVRNRREARRYRRCGRGERGSWARRTRAEPPPCKAPCQGQCLSPGDRDRKRFGVCTYRRFVPRPVGSAAAESALAPGGTFAVKMVVLVRSLATRSRRQRRPAGRHPSAERRNRQQNHEQCPGCWGWVRRDVAGQAKHGAGLSDEGC